MLATKTTLDAHNSINLDIDDDYRMCDDKSPDKKESSPLTSSISSARCSAESLRVSENATPRCPDGLFLRAWHSIQGFKDAHIKNSSDEESVELTKIIAEGKTLHQLAESLQGPHDEETSPHGWKASLLKRCLIGAGILTGTGVIGNTAYRYYAGSRPSTESTGNNTWPESVKNNNVSAPPATAFMPAGQHRSRGLTPDDALSNPMGAHNNRPYGMKASDHFSGLKAFDERLTSEKDKDYIEFLRGMEIIKNLKVADLDVILNGTKSIPSNNKREAESNVINPAFLGAELMRLFYIGGKSDLITDELKEIYWMAKDSADVNRCSSQKAKDFRHFLKCIELVFIFRNEILKDDFNIRTYTASTIILEQLNILASKLTDYQSREDIKKLRQYLENPKNSAANNRDTSGYNINAKIAEFQSSSQSIRFELESLLPDLIYLRCINIIRSESIPKEYLEAVNSFLNRDIQAKEAYFHDHHLNGAFFIPAGKTGGVWLSVDDPSYFLAKHKIKPFKLMENTPPYPDTKAFKDWVFNRLPDAVSAKLKRDENVFLERKSIQNGHHDFSHSTYSPLSFSENLNYDNLIRNLKKGIEEQYPDIDDFEIKYSYYLSEWLNKQSETSNRVIAKTKNLISEPIETEQKSPFIYSRYYVSGKNEVSTNSRSSDISIAVNIFTNAFGKKEVIISETGFPVDIKHLYPCIITRDELSYAEVFRQIGKSLMHPVTTLALESQVINNHVTSQNGCPQSDEQRALADYTVKFDEIISSIIALIPSAQPLVIVQGLIGPVMVMIADDIEGKPADLSFVKEMHSNLLNICTQIVRAQAHDLRVKLQEGNALVNFIPHDIDYYNQKLYVTIYGKKKALIYKDQHIYVQGRQLNEVFYDMQDEVWRYIDDSLNPRVVNKNVLNLEEADNYDDFFMNYYNPAQGNHDLNRINDAARYYSLRYSDEQSAGVFLAKILRKSGIISADAVDTLSDNLDRPVLPVNQLLDQPRPITSDDQLLHIKKGEILCFLSKDMDGENFHTAHHLIALGNGRFCGVRNHILTGEMSTEPRFLTAEQLGSMENGILSPFHNSDKKLHLYSGYPANHQSPYLYTLFESAEFLSDNKPGNFIREISTVLANSGDLSPEQAEQFYQKANILINDSLKNTGLQASSSSNFIGESRVIFSNEFKNVDAGRIIIIYDKLKKPVSIALSLGDGNFLIDNSRVRVETSAKNKNIISYEKMASIFHDENFSFTENSLDASRLRVGSLLGNDALFSYSSSSATLTVRAHGAPGNVNMLNPFELADVIRGLLIKSKIDIRMIKTINLESCFGGLGLPSSGEALASLLDKKVVAYTGRFSVHQRDNPSRWSFMVKTYEPPITEINRNSIINQCKRNYRLMNTLGNIYHYLSRRRVVRSDNHMPEITFNVLISNVARLALRQMTVEEFVKLQPEYDDSDKKPLNFLNAEKIPSNVYGFIERCIDILSLNEKSFSIFNEAITGNS